MSEWISVDDRLPKEGQEVLFLAEDYTSPMICFGALRENSEYAFYDYSVVYSDGEYGECHNVTHWQPLPSPPES